MKKIITALLSILYVVFLFSSTNLVAADNNKTSKNPDGSPKFDEKNIVLRFASISDTHIQGTDQVPSKKLSAALEQLNAKAKGKLDAIVVAGDLTDYGLPDQVSELKRVLDNSLVDLNNTKLIFAIGNHEYYNNQLKGAEWKGGYLLKDVFGDRVYQGATEAEIKAGNYHAVVNGYDFIAINCVQYDGGIKYAESDIKWLKEELSKAASDHPGKPVFTISHPNITGTNLGSDEGDYWAGRDLYDVFKDYPQVIFFCGHLHFPENDERSIWQGDFTTVGLGSTYYSSNHPLDDETMQTFIDVGSGYETNDAFKTSQGLYVEIDKNNNVRMTRMDFANKEEIKNPWIVPSPKKDKSHLLYYTPKQEEKDFGKTAPVFSADAKVKIISGNIASGELKIEFTQAIDNDLVYSYQVSFIDKAEDKVIKTISTLSDFFLHASPGKMSATLIETIVKADSVLAPFSLLYNKDYYIRVIAVDCFGNKSKPIVSRVINNSADLKKQGALPGRSLKFYNYAYIKSDF